MSMLGKKTTGHGEFGHGPLGTLRRSDERSIRRQAKDLGVPNFLVRLVGVRQASRMAEAAQPANGYD